MNGKDLTATSDPPSLARVKDLWERSAIAFRGYNVTNLGRTPELLEHPKYGEHIRRNLIRGSRAYTEITGQPCDLVERVRQRRETSLECYGEALSLIMAVSVAHLEILQDFFDLPAARVRVTFGYSLGEIAALVAGGVLTLENALRIPLELANDCVALSHNVTLGVLFSRGDVLEHDAVTRLCQDVNSQGAGVVGNSAVLSPNSLLLIGQDDTLDRLLKHAHERLPERAHLRKNPHAWPPLHTPIIWQRCIADRSGVLLHTLPVSETPPSPPVLSLVTGQFDYQPGTTRDLLRRWVYEPQRLWEAVVETLNQDIDLIVHLGPEPNIIPATYRRLSDNVRNETKAHVGMRALSAVVEHPWLRALLPERAALLRAPQLQQLVLEDWLLHSSNT